MSNLDGFKYKSIYNNSRPNLVTHDEFDVTFDRSVKPDTSLNVTVEAVTGTLNLDNDRNVGVLQIDMNISQPGMSCIYLIRAY